MKCIHLMDFTHIVLRFVPQEQGPLYWEKTCRIIQYENNHKYNIPNFPETRVARRTTYLK